MLVASQVAPGKPKILHCSDLTDDERHRLHGRGTHSALPPLTVGEPTEVTFEFEVGEQPIATNGRMLVVWRWPFDWGDLQFTDPNEPGYLQVIPRLQDDRSVELSCKYNWIAGIEPWHHQLQIVVAKGELLPFERVTLRCREWQAPTCVAARCRFLMLVDHRGTGERIRLVPTPTFAVVPSQPVRMTAILPSDAIVGETVELLVRADDQWGNPTEIASDPRIACDGMDVLKCLDIESIRPTRRYQVRFPQAGHFQVGVDEAGGLQATSNRVAVVADEPSRRLYWGDLHSGQSEIGCGCGSLDEHYAFGRDCAGLSFLTHQANDHYVTREEWNQTRTITEAFYEPGRYVPFLGCEWSPLTKDGGDRNVFYRHDDPVLRRSDRFFLEDEPDPEPDIRTAPEFHQAFRDRDVLVNIHVGGRMTNLDWHEPCIERLCETHSTHGTVEWFFREAIARGYRVGLTAGTDGVMGRPGACHPGRRLIRNLPGGLTAVYASSLDRESLWTALRNRHCYATTGERIRLEVFVDGHPMGGEFSTSGRPNIHIRAEGTAALERVDLFRNNEMIQSWDVAEPECRTGHRTRFLWGGTERRGTARLQSVNWDGRLSLRGGSMKLVRSVGFQSHDDEMRQTDSCELVWSSKTAGNSVGAVIDFEFGKGGEVLFDAGPLRRSFVMDEIAEGLRIDAEGVNRFVQVGPSPDPDGPREFEGEHRCSLPVDATSAFWVRIVQVDQGMAWSSPVYVDPEPERK